MLIPADDFAAQYPAPGPALSGPDGALLAVVGHGLQGHYGVPQDEGPAELAELATRIDQARRSQHIQG
ncbi:hypothetical protein [Methylobacterium sp. A54F]